MMKRKKKDSKKTFANRVTSLCLTFPRGISPRTQTVSMADSWRLSGLVSAQRKAIKPGVYTDAESLRLFRAGEEYTQHRVSRLIIGESGHAFAQIEQPCERPGQWEDTSLAGQWSESEQLQEGYVIIKLLDDSGTNFMIPSTAIPQRFSPDDLKILEGVAALTVWPLSVQDFTASEAALQLRCTSHLFSSTG
jgi:hypothetical protein